MNSAAQRDEWVNDQYRISAPVAALFRFGAALHIDRGKRGEHVTSSSLLYALHKVDSDHAPQSLIDDPAARAFCSALRELGDTNGTAMAEAWQDYDTSLISLGVTIPPQSPRISANIRRLIEEAAARAATEQASSIGTAHLIDAILAQPTSRMKRRLVRADIDVAKLDARYREILAELRDRRANIIDTGWHPLANGIPPVWASGWGQDEYGVFTEITVEDVTQRLRWIPPGRFLMGSPKDEPGHWDGEGPQTEVTIEHGYWLFDTPVTQALWQAVIGENPSQFVSAKRPVERVSWNDAKRFLAAMNDRFAGLALYLPSEAQWEYACRGGTDDATYAGPIEIIGENNAPIVDTIAWYGGNSGVNFELEGGKTSSAWPEKQYAHDKAGTREVKQKRANAYGLYDMLGNVWELCADMWHHSHEGADPKGAPRQSDSQSSPHLLVVRGGSWLDGGRIVRAAFRIWVVPDNGDDDLGFRCAARQGEYPR